MGLPEEIALPYMDSLQKAFEDGKPVEHFNPLPTPDGEGYFYSRISPEKMLLVKWKQYWLLPGILPRYEKRSWR
ncbi:hypothetical protein AHMF7605_28445 [Adhaeribacter arboris]|uniref:Uncharacterized protein n=1 Tax=Adhaeribacter arboris TaxID=2072846 RepID=A0A2T2Y8L0_9BACT|nr:hypothetical protein [Adhaeribacter arboris]PSR51847.1 hypothetical protein AHMF7605_28445 [Adhaeribacter arboris]